MNLIPIILSYIYFLTETFSIFQIFLVVSLVYVSYLLYQEYNLLQESIAAGEPSAQSEPLKPELWLNLLVGRFTCYLYWTLSTERYNHLILILNYEMLLATCNTNYSR